MAFKNLKTSRSSAINQLIQAAEKAGGTGEKKSYGDDRLWKPTVDKSGNGYAVLRFLPAAEGEDLPWARYWDHGFKGPTGKWYIENSLSTIGETDPVGELNSQLWNSGVDADKETARKQKRRLHYVTNVLVVSDPGNPSNEGKVLLFKFGKKIYDKIMDVMQPQFQDEHPINPFDFWEGADFKLKIRQVEGYRNYDKSEFASPAPLLGGDDDQLEALYNKLNPLSEFTDPKNFKSYEELKKKLDSVLGVKGGMPLTTAESIDLDTSTAAPAPSKSIDEPSFTPATASDEDDDDTMSYFSKLANS